MGTWRMGTWASSPSLPLRCLYRQTTKPFLLRRGLPRLLLLLLLLAPPPPGRRRLLVLLLLLLLMLLTHHGAVAARGRPQLLDDGLLEPTTRFHPLGLLLAFRIPAQRLFLAFLVAIRWAFS